MKWMCTINPLVPLAPLPGLHTTRKCCRNGSMQGSLGSAGRGVSQAAEAQHSFFEESAALSTGGAHVCSSCCHRLHQAGAPLQLVEERERFSFVTFK